MRMWRNQRIKREESAATAISRNSIVKRDFFTNLPQEITIDILSRLPLPTIINCKCVCKAWRHLLSTPEFVDCHCSKSLPGLILSKEEVAGRENSKRYKILEFMDSGHRRPCKTVFDFSVPHRATLISSANGLLLFVNYNNQNPCVCNPLTREYIDLPPPTESPHFWYSDYGFGVSKASGEYKVLRISVRESSYKFEVHTLGTESWRNVGGGALPHRDRCVFVDGKLYSLVKELCMMNCFDLETELFSTVSCPSSRDYGRHVCELGGRLCLCLNDYDDVVIWLMNEVGHWMKEFVIRKPEMYATFSAIKVFGDGEILLVKERARRLYYYSRKRNGETLEPVGVTWKSSRYQYRIGYTPNFLSLKTFNSPLRIYATSDSSV